jgi:hypothetical protein
MVDVVQKQSLFGKLFRNPRITAALAVALFFFSTFDTWFILRTVLMAAKLVMFPRKRRALADVSEIQGRVMPTDLDWLLHMNNSKYLRELDFGRVDFWLSNGVFKEARKKGWYFVLGAMNIRYRRELNLFQVRSRGVFCENPL